ncbi:MAG: sulfurtransferase TusA family protein [Chromatiales bacterium]|nr:sulfurtransferase TusA family protein [Chromatiales bacterium]
MSETMHTLDASGLNCPLPILRTKKALAPLDRGEILEVISTDPGSVKDLSSFCKETGHELLSSEAAEGKFVFQIRKA